jgi:Major intrinsic protein
MRDAMRLHWPEYLIEATGLGLFMMSAGLFAVLLFHPGSLAAETMLGSLGRRMLMGLAMGLTAVALVYSRWGKRSGAHFNPAVTLTFFRLGKVSGWDAFFYVAAQWAGGLGGMLLAARVKDASERPLALVDGRALLVSPGIVPTPDAALGFRSGFLARDPDGHVAQFRLNELPRSGHQIP